MYSLYHILIHFAIFFIKKSGVNIAKLSTPELFIIYNFCLILQRIVQPSNYFLSLPFPVRIYANNQLFQRFDVRCILMSCDNVHHINKRPSRISRITGDAPHRKCANGVALNDLRAHCAHIKSNFSYHHPRLYIRMFFIFHSFLYVLRFQNHYKYLRKALAYCPFHKITHIL